MIQNTILLIMLHNSFCIWNVGPEKFGSPQLIYIYLFINFAKHAFPSKHGPPRTNFGPFILQGSKGDHTPLLFEHCMQEHFCWSAAGHLLDATKAHHD